MNHPGITFSSFETPDASLGRAGLADRTSTSRKAVLSIDGFASSSAFVRYALIQGSSVIKPKLPSRESAGGEHRHVGAALAPHFVAAHHHQAFAPQLALPGRMVHPFTREK